MMSSYILDAMDTWSLDFAAKTEEVRSVSLTFCFILIGIVFALHIFVNEWKVIRSVEK